MTPLGPWPGVSLASGVPAANIHRLSASSAELRHGVEPATAENLLRQIADLPARPGDHCLVFMTSHGEHDAGLWLARSQRALHPEELAQALSRGCAMVPTVVIVSGCYTGGFAAGPMAEPNRIILTAARRDRPSFGCQVERTYTVFDQCLLGALPQSANWQAVFSRTSRCVSRQEHARGELPSEPQAYFGSAVADYARRLLSFPTQRRGGPIGPTAIVMAINAVMAAAATGRGFPHPCSPQYEC